VAVAGSRGANVSPSKVAATARPNESIEYRPGIGPSDSMSAEM
jgi:hypothetical protein